MSIRSGMFFLLSLLVVGTPYYTEAAPKRDKERTIKVVGKKESTVTKRTVLLGDVAQVSSRYVRDDEALIALKKISLGKSPLPGKPITITAARILERMREEGVDLNVVGYALPRTVKIHRASRPITAEEVETVVQAVLEESGRDIKLVDIDYQGDTQVVPGVTELTAKLYSSGEPGRSSIVITAKVEDEPPVQFTVNASVEEWTTVPVARRPIFRGNIVGASDVVMARLNTSQIPADAAQDSENVVGYATKRNISSGEIFRKNKLEIPPIIEAGARVTLKYVSPLLEATATGVALESGIAGQKIRVRNEQSRKTVAGTILEPGLVGVSP